MPVNPNFPIQSTEKNVTLWPGLQALLDEGALFSMSSTTIASGKAGGTAIATTTSVVDDAATASATHAQNVPVAYWYNASPANDPNARTIYPLSLRMTVSQAPTSATVWSYAIRADNVPRYTSGGSALTAVNLNTGSSNTSILQGYFGAVVTTNLPSAAQRVLASGQIHSAIPTTKDVWIFTFGDMTMPSSILTAAAAKNINIPTNPMAWGPGWAITLEMWGASNAAAPSWEFDFVYAERQSGL